MSVNYSFKVEVGFKFDHQALVRDLARQNPDLSKMGIDDFIDWLLTHFPREIDVEACSTPFAVEEIAVYARRVRKHNDSSNPGSTMNVGGSIPLSSIEGVKFPLEQCIAKFNELGLSEIPPLSAIAVWNVG